MHAVVAHAGHSHGLDPALVALPVVLVVLGVAAISALVQRRRARRTAGRTLTG
jgi:hypothetical protein